MEPATGLPGDDTQNNTQEMVLYFSAEQQAEVKVSINGTTWNRTYNVPANSVIASDYMPKSAGADDSRLFSVPPSFGGTGSEGIFNRGIYIKSNVPIVAYAHTFGRSSSGATMLMPVETWGYYYMSVNSKQVYATNCFSWTYVVASHDKTKILVTPSVNTRSGNLAGVPIPITLNKGQIYQVVGANPNSSAEALEVSGTTFKSIANDDGECFPIAAFSGSSRTSNPMICGTSNPSTSGDNDNQQLFPVQAWGKRYLTAPTSSSLGPGRFMTNAYKVLVKDPATTTVTRNGVTLTGLVNNYYYFESNTADLIESNHPIMVAQFMTGGVCTNGGSGDPEMIYISPIEQGIKRIGFFRNNREAITTNYVTMVVPNGGTGISSLRIDGAALSAIPAAELHTYPHPMSAAHTVVVRRWNGFAAAPALPPGQCIVSGDSAFTAITYGLGSVESYGYNAGTLINNLSAIGAIHNIADPDNQEHTYTCVNTPVALSVLTSYAPTKLVWKLSALAGVVTPAADIVDEAPVSIGSAVIKGVTYYKYTLPGTYLFSAVGVHRLPIFTTHPTVENCNNTEETKIEIQVKDNATTDFTFTRTTDCTLDSVYFNAATTSAEGYTFKKWNWTFPGNKLATGKDTVHRFEPGANQVIKLAVVSNEGCTAEVSKNITVYAPPVASVSTTTGPVCESGSGSFTSSFTYGGTAPAKSWYWNIAATEINAGTAAPQSGVFREAGSSIVKHVLKLSEHCISDTVRLPVTIYALPDVDIEYSKGCLPASGEVTFVNETNTPDGQAITAHLWNFGDAAAAPANNTSTAESPTHVYSTFGAYDITYKVTSEQGCIKDTIIKATFNVLPKVDYPALQPVCESAAAYSIATATVDGSVATGGIYSGKGVTANGIFDPAIAGAGTHTITYSYTSAAGCKGEDNSNIEVYARPVAAFTVADDFCMNETIRVTPATQPAAQTWNWTFPAGNASYTNSNAFNAPAATAAGAYKIEVATVNQRGCTNLATKTVQIHPLPTADFTVPTKVCVPGSATFLNSSTVAGGGALTYEWRFSDAATVVVSDKDPVRNYTSITSHQAQLKVVTAFGCETTSVSKPVTDFYQRPTANFTYAPAEICEGEDVTFTDASTPANTATTWNWIFDDGSTFNTQSVVRKLEKLGLHTVTLAITNAIGCSATTTPRNVTVYAQPRIDAGRSFVALLGSTVQFDATASSPASFAWTPATALSNPTILKPSLMVNSDQTYVLTAVGEHNCTAKDSLTVTLLRTVIVPNVFSPNNDRINDRWEIPNLSDYRHCMVQIFNRYGQKVYESRGYGTPWDGKMNGKELAAGTYYYIINLSDGSKPLTGAVTIIR